LFLIFLTQFLGSFSLFVSPCFSSLLGFISSLPQLAWDKRLCCCCCCCSFLDPSLTVKSQQRSWWPQIKPKIKTKRKKWSTRSVHLLPYRAWRGWGSRWHRGDCGSDGRSRWRSCPAARRRC
jgi:hypothetical protein